MNAPTFRSGDCVRVDASGEPNVPIKMNSPAGRRLDLSKDSYVYGRSERCIWVLPPRDCVPNGKVITHDVFEAVAKITVFLM